MKKALATIALTLLPFSAVAADLPMRSAAPSPIAYTAPAFSWAGFYVGLNAGGAWATKCADYGLNYGGSAYSGWDDNCRSSNTQLTGGAQVGYNFQSGNLVYGIEADINAVGSSNDSRREIRGPAGALLNSTFRITGVGDPGVFGTVRARLGFSANRALFYVTGGLAWASGTKDPSVEFWSAARVGAPDVVFTRDGKGSMGWALGAGVEYAIANNWTLRAEYLYVDLGKEDNAWNCAATPAYASACAGASAIDLSGRKSINFNVARLGVNYKFGGASSGPVVARY